MAPRAKPGVGSLSDVDELPLELELPPLSVEGEPAELEEPPEDGPTPPESPPLEVDPPEAESDPSSLFEHATTGENAKLQEINDA